jgi:hypothetical protein
MVNAVSIRADRRRTMMAICPSLCPFRNETSELSIKILQRWRLGVPGRSARSRQRGEQAWVYRLHGYTVTRASPWAGPCTSREAHRYTTYWPPETQDSRSTAGGTRSARETRVGRRWRAIGPVTRSDPFREREDGMTYLTRDPYGKTGDGACARHLHLRYHDWQEEQVPNKVLSRLDQLTLTPCQGNVLEKCRPC